MNYYSDPDFQVALHGPICPRLSWNDAIVINEDSWYRTITPSSHDPCDNEIILSNLNEREGENKADTVIAEYHNIGSSMWWYVYPWTKPETLGEQLIQRGATCREVQAVVCKTSLPLAIVLGVEVEQVMPAATDTYEEYIDMMSFGMGLSQDATAFRRRHYRKLIGEPDPVLQLFIAYCKGTVAGCGATYLKPDAGYLTGDYVVPEFRAHGIFQSLIAARLPVLNRMGIPAACGHAWQDTSFPWLKRFGFRSVYPYKIYQLDPE